jgi:hypothetical protein
MRPFALVVTLFEMRATPTAGELEFSTIEGSLIP